MKTRLRRYYWSSVRPGGHPLEYVGDPMEKLLGFLIAVVALAFYIGIVNLILMYLSFALFQGDVTAYALSFAGVIPIWFYAMYRARRYVLARTRWRGIRFGVEPGAWGYAGRALLHWGITILSLGLLWPRMTFMLEKYKIDRTFLGNQRLEQGGRWQMLYRPFVPAVLCGVAIALGSAAIGDWRGRRLAPAPHPCGFRAPAGVRPLQRPVPPAPRQHPHRRPPRPRGGAPHLPRHRHLRGRLRAHPARARRAPLRGHARHRPRLRGGRRHAPEPRGPAGGPAHGSPPPSASPPTSRSSSSGASSAMSS
jgi:hypothetical protein